jgi:hypothetical protein
MALLLADAMVLREQDASDDINHFDRSLETNRTHFAPAADLAGSLAASVIKPGCDSRPSVLYVH